jgi:chromosome segregation ATPase
LTLEQFVGFVLLLSMSLGTAAGAFWKASRANKDAQATRSNSETNRVEVDQLRAEIHSLRGRLAEQRDIYAALVENLQKKIAEMQRELIAAREKELQLIRALQDEHTKSASLRAQVESLEAQVKDLQQQIKFMMQKG